MYKGDYQLIGSEMSFFTRKLEAQLRYQQILRRWTRQLPIQLNPTCISATPDCCWDLFCWQ